MSGTNMVVTSKYNLEEFASKHTSVLIGDTFRRLEERGIKAADAEFIRKGIIPADVKFEKGERAVLTYITTNQPDRDHEIVLKEGVILDDYRKHPVVLFGHDYHGLPIGKNEEIFTDDVGLIAKTVYPEKGFGAEVYEYRKAGFPLAESIGFIPLEVQEVADSSDSGVRRIFTEWVLLEYSDVPIPSNPGAIQIAISKGMKPVKNIAEVEGAGQFTAVLDDDNFVHFTEAVEKEQAQIIIADLRDIIKSENTKAGKLPKSVAEDFCNKHKIEIFGTDIDYGKEAGKIWTGENFKTEDSVTKNIGKAPDVTGNPSVWDIAEAIGTILRGQSSDKVWKWIQDIFPTKYPDGHVIISVEDKKGRKFLQHDYTFKDGKATLSKGFTELEFAYKPKNSIGQDLKDLRMFEELSELKEGRVLSKKIMKLMHICIEDTEKAINGMRKILDEAEIQTHEDDKKDVKPDNVRKFDADYATKLLEVIKIPEKNSGLSEADMIKMRAKGIVQI